MTSEPSQPFAHRIYADGVVELGRRRSTGFSGTDALGMSVITRVEPWLADLEAPVLFGEGDRLANARFFRAAQARGPLEVVLLEDPAGLASARRAQRGSNQKPAWLRGRESKVFNLAAEWATRIFYADETPDVLGARLREIIWPEG